MKNIRWNILILTCAICLLPILLGMALWSQLPDVMAIHFNINNEPDGFASKAFVVYGFPCMMVLFQVICCVSTDLVVVKHPHPKKLELVAKWIIPVMSIFLYVVTLGYGLEWDIDIRRCAVLIVGLEFLVIGNYMPKLDYVKNYKMEPEKARKVNRFMGRGCVVFGLLALVTLFLPPVTSVIWLLVLLLFTLVSVIYAIRMTKSR